jgi:hypothetical protein
MIFTVLLAPLLFRFKIKKPHISHPFLRKGSYEYQTSFRNSCGLLFACYLLVFVGLYTGNENLAYVFHFSIGLLCIDSQIKGEAVLYTANFLCVKDICELKLKNVFYNTTVLYIPVLIPCSVMNFNLSGKLFFMTLLIAVLSYISLLLGYCFPVFLSRFLVIVILLPLFFLSLIHPYLSLLFPLIAIFLFIKMNKRLKHLFQYDTNK